MIRCRGDPSKQVQPSAHHQWGCRLSLVLLFVLL